MKQLACALTLLALAGQGGSQAPSKVTLDFVKYDVLAKKVVDNRGKVVLVDLWNFLCLPCKNSFPHLVEMQKKYGPQGFVAISVALDDHTIPESREVLEKFLKDKGATFTNYWLNEPAEVWQKKFGVVGFPAIFLFDRDGKWTRFYVGDAPVNDGDIEKKVQELLKK